MGRTSTEVIITVLNYGLQYGVPAVLDIIEAWNKDEITDEDIDQLGLQMEMRDTDLLRYPNE